MSCVSVPARSIWHRFSSDVLCEAVVTLVQVPVLLPIHAVAAAYLVLSAEVASVERCVGALALTMALSALLVVVVRNLAVPHGHLFGTPFAMTVSSAVGPLLAAVVALLCMVPAAPVTALTVGGLAGVAHAATLLVWLRPWRSDDHASEPLDAVATFPMGVVHVKELSRAA